MTIEFSTSDFRVMAPSQSNRTSDRPPYFSICVPHYNRTDFLIAACERLRRQSFTDFELCISDDCSTDGKAAKLLDYLRSSGITFNYLRTARNLRYDANLRSAISLSRGRYLMLMGNDDQLSDVDSLRDIHDNIEHFSPVAVAITNYREIAEDIAFRRMASTGIVGEGAAVAARVFRNYAFVSGVILDGDAARAAETRAVDGSEMYQMYLATRIVASGGRLLGIDRICIEKDVQIAGQSVESYRDRPLLLNCPIVKRKLPMGRLLEVVAKGLAAAPGNRQDDKLVFAVARDLYLYTYPFWGVEYRRVQSRRYALGVLMALNPHDISPELPRSRLLRAQLWAIYLTCSAMALLIPIRLFDALREKLYSIAKRAQSL